MGESDRKERKQAKIRHTIIKAATTLVLEDGLESFSMRKLADRIDYSPAALYKYYANKEAILDAVRNAALFRMQQMYDDDRNFKALQPIGQIRFMCSTVLQFAELYPDLYRLIYQRFNQERPDFKEIFSTFHFRYMQTVLHRAVNESSLELPPGFTEELVVLQLWVTLHGIICLRQTLMQDESIFHQVSDQLLEAMLNNLGTEEIDWQVPVKSAEESQ
ncbi:MAG: TetR/AcrR family transcriptional regulator [Anaerolineaceae bacterium]|nr:TetR/AcrR family transcriptional regulator [Anaerolineaceae bacterium]